MVCQLLVITIANNQKLIAKELKKLIHLIGHYDKISIDTIYSALKEFIDIDLEHWSKSCKAITNGLGAKKIASLLTLNNKTKFSRKAQIKDKDFYIKNYLESFKNKAIKVKPTFFLCLEIKTDIKLVLGIQEDYMICQIHFKLDEDKWNIITQDSCLKKLN